jgi:hypothetical protein
VDEREEGTEKWYELEEMDEAVANGLVRVQVLNPEP